MEGSHRKRPMFTVEERLGFLRASVEDLRLDNVTVESFNALLIDHAREVRAMTVVKGLRAISDFDYEFQMAQINQTLAPDMDVVLFMAGHRYTFFSSSTVREIASLGGDVSWLVPPHVVVALKRVYGQHS